MDISKLVNLTLEQTVSIITVIVLSVTIILFRKIVKVNFFKTLFPFTLFSILLLSQNFVKYSVFPYLLFVYIWLGVWMLFYHYKKNYYFKVSQFFKKFIVAISFCTFIIWIGVVVYTIVDVMIK